MEDRPRAADDETQPIPISPASPGPVPPPPPAARRRTAGNRGAAVGTLRAGRARPRWPIAAAGGLGLAILLAWWIAASSESRPTARGAAPVVAGAPAATAAAHVVLTLRDTPGTLALLSDGSIAGLPGIAEATGRKLARALASGELPVPGELPTSHVELPDAALPAPDLVALAPIATRVLDERPWFRWTPWSEARTYRVIVYDERAGVVVESPELRNATDWRPPRPLPRGRSLYWRVAARDRAGTERSAPSVPAMEGAFALVSPEELAWYEREVDAARGAKLVAAALAAELGARDDAAAALGDLVAANPPSPLLARLLGELRSRRHAVGSRR
ncbi:MAG: hypothetical protein U0X73_07375 [Thermoanaerobaculia bacterium]